MAEVVYPVAAWEVNSDMAFAIVLGEAQQAVDATVSKACAQLTRAMSQASIVVSEPVIGSPSLLHMKVEIQPAYMEGSHRFPLPHTVHLPVSAVHGATSYGDYLCYLPQFSIEFHYYDPEQLKPLITHFVRSHFDRHTPEEVFRYMALPTLQLESIRVKKRAADRRRRHGGRPAQPTLARVAERFPPKRGISRKTSVLPRVSWERSQSVSSVAWKVLQEEANLLVVGDTGVGKSTVLEEAAKSIYRDTKSNGKRVLFWRTSAKRMTAGARYLGEWQQICEDLVQELEDSDGILYVTDVVDLLSTGGRDPSDSLAQFMLPFLVQGKLRLVGEVTPRELEAIRQRLPGFAEHFQLHYLEELDRSQMLRILQYFSDYSEKNLRIEFDRDALEVGYRLMERYFRSEKFPGKLMRFLGECVNEALLRKQKNIDRKMIIDQFVQKTGISEALARDDVRLDTGDLSDYFNRKILGQPHAVDQLCGLVKLFKAGLSDPGKPISILLFAGPTGVGKTASAKALAQYFFGAGQVVDPMIRLDMSEFQYPGQIARLIGSPGGEVGELVRKIRERPFSILLLDEIEKADTSFFDALMTVFDEGVMVDANGREADFRNSIIIMTSNLGAQKRAAIGFADTEKPDYSFVARQFFRPEFFNRIDDVITFEPLGRETIEHIVRKELSELEQRDGIAKRNLKLDFSDDLVAYICETGFDERYGARPLQRTIERTVVDVLSRYLLDKPDIANQAVSLGLGENGEPVIT